MMKRVDDENQEDDEDDDEIINFKRVSSLYDESVEVVGADDIQSPPSSAGVAGLKNPTRENNSTNQVNVAKVIKHFPTPTAKLNIEEEVSKYATNSPWKGKERGLISNTSDNSENSEDEDDDDDDDDDDVRAPVLHGAYDPNDYEQLVVSEEIKDIFSYIIKYTPQNVDLENKLCPFLPDFIPAIGDIDAFIKVPRPDGKKDGLGLIVLDEPCTQQSDPAVLQLQLRAVAKQSSAKTVVKKIENAEKNGKSIDRWIKAISDLHGTKPSPTVRYTRPMPNLDNLMQEWPPEVEEKLNATAIPHPDLDCDLSTYAGIICNLFDIPVYDSTIQSLHAFFSLYSTMKSTQGQLMQSEVNE